MKRRPLQPPAHTHRGAGTCTHISEHTKLPDWSSCGNNDVKENVFQVLWTDDIPPLSLQTLLRHGVQCSWLHQRWLPCPVCPLPALCCLTQQRLAFLLIYTHVYSFGWLLWPILDTWGLIYNRCVSTKRCQKEAYATSDTVVGIYKNTLDVRTCTNTTK